MFASRNHNQAKQPERGRPERGDSAPDRKTAFQLNPIWQSLAIRSGVLYPKLTISQAGDPYEREADRVADQVMRMPAPQSDGRGLSITPLADHQAQRKCAECEDEEEEGALQLKESAAAESPATAPPIVHQTLNSPGRPLDAATRAYFEPRFGHDFSEVRMHDDAGAAQSARAVNALAYTIGSDIVLGKTQHASNTNGDGRLLAHELAHVVQQTGGSDRGTAAKLTGSDPRLARTPADEEAESATTGFYGLPVGHGAFNISIEGGKVIVYDAGTHGSQPDPKIIDDAITQAKQLIPEDKVIHEFRISHLHQDHINFLQALRNNGFKIETVVVNLYQLEFAKAYVTYLQQNLDPKTTLRVLYYDSGGLEAMDYPMSTFSIMKLAELQGKLRTDFPSGNLGLGPVTGSYEGEEYKAYTAPNIAVDHAAQRAKQDVTGRSTNLGVRLDTFSTIYVDSRIPEVRVIHGADLRTADWMLFTPDTAFHEDLSESAPSLTLWLLSHHMMHGFISNDPDTGAPSPEAVLRFCDQMIQYRLAPTAEGPAGIHIVSASVDVEKVSLAIPYLFRASGFEVILSHAGTPVTVKGSGAGEFTGELWNGPLPGDSPLMASYQALRALHVMGMDGKEKDDLIEEIRTARLAYVIEVLKLLRKNISEPYADIIKAINDQATRISSLMDMVETFLFKKPPSGGSGGEGSKPGLDELISAHKTPLETEATPVTGGIGEETAVGSTIWTAEFDPLLGASPQVLPEFLPPAFQRQLLPEYIPDLTSEGVREFIMVPAAESKPEYGTRPLLLPEYIPDLTSEKVREVIRIPASGSQLGVEAPAPAMPLQAPATGGPRPVEVPTSGKQLPMLAPPQPQMLSTIETPVTPRELPEWQWPPGTPSGGKVIAPGGSQSATSRPLSGEAGAAAGLGGAMVVESAANEWVNYLTTQEIEKAQQAIDALNQEISQEREENHEMGAIILVSFSEPWPGYPHEFLGASYTMVPGLTLADAQEFYSRQIDMFADPVCPEIITRNYKWVPPKNSTETEAYWSKPDICDTPWADAFLQWWGQLWERLKPGMFRGE